MDKIWWNNITNAVQYTKDITDCLLEGKSIILTSEMNIPWSATMNEIVEDSVKTQDSQRNFKHIFDDIDNPGKYIFNEFCKEEKRAMFRPGIGYPEFLAANDDLVLNNTYVWIHNIPSEKLDKWITFVADYNKYSKKHHNHGIFILDTDGFAAIKNARGIPIATIDEYISRDDIYIFSMLALSSNKKSTYYKQYLSELAANIAGNNAERASAYVTENERFLENPYEVVCELMDKSEEDMNAIREKIERVIWKSQIKVVFPLIEEYREKFISRYCRKISAQLPIENNYETFETPNDVDIGSLWYLVHRNMIYVSKYDLECIDIIRTARNILAHINVLPYDTVEKIFDLF